MTLPRVPRSDSPVPPTHPVPYPQRIAVIGAGVAGACCAQRLAQSGSAVELFEANGDVGGRLSTLSPSWSDHGTTAFDHGAPGFTARSEAFRRFVHQGHLANGLAPWRPVIAPHSYRPLDQLTLWVPVPEASALCRHLSRDLPLTLHCRIEALRLKDQACRWQLISQGAVVGQPFDTVVLATPPEQAARLLQPYRSDWAQHAARTPMAPCWTLIGLAEASPADLPSWQAAWPDEGPLALIARDDSKPGRHTTATQIRWVAHAKADWSQAHRNDSAQHVLVALQSALSAQLRCPIRWQHATTHHWYQASALRANTPSPTRCWWDARGGLGVCGDYLGGAGVEGAWLSGQAMAAAIEAESAPPTNPALGLQDPA